MTKDANGLWTVTLGPLEPNLYEYQFNLDGRKITDPGNDMPKPQRQVDTSLLKCRYPDPRRHGKLFGQLEDARYR